MSIDHKPEDENETKRIRKAGGKITSDGRVNGGLNLSRAIGMFLHSVMRRITIEGLYRRGASKLIRFPNSCLNFENILIRNHIIGVKMSKTPEDAVGGKPNLTVQYARRPGS